MKKPTVKDLIDTLQEDDRTENELLFIINEQVYDLNDAYISSDKDFVTIRFCMKETNTGIGYDNGRTTY